MSRWILAGALCAACTFPEVDYETAGAGAAATGGASGSTTTDASSSQTGTGASDCGFNVDWPQNCDGDGDGWPNDTCCSVKEERDCYDQNEAAFPGADPPGTSGDFYTTDRGDGSFDYNCDDEEEPEYGEGDCTTLSCSTPPNPTYAFDPNGNYECGVAGVTRYCTGTMTCVADPMQSPTLRCR
jgi:hypothetical protein